MNINALLNDNNNNNTAAPVTTKTETVSSAPAVPMMPAPAKMVMTAHSTPVSMMARPQIMTNLHMHRPMSMPMMPMRFPVKSSNPVGRPPMMPVVKSPVPAPQENADPNVPAGTGDRVSTLELGALFRSAASNQSLIRAQRDVAILAIMIDLKFSSQKLSELTLAHAQKLINGEADGLTCPQTGYFVACHEKTAEYIREYLNAMKNQYDWDMKDMQCPLFVSLQLTDTSQAGGKAPRKSPLRRDAVSKIYMAIKNRSGVLRCTRELVMASRMEDVDPSTFEEELTSRSSLVMRHGVRTSSPYTRVTATASPMSQGMSSADSDGVSVLMQLSAASEGQK